MATIGLDKLYYATITEAQDTGEETYGTPKKLAEAISVELSVESAEGSLYADDKVSESVREFSGGTISINTNDIAPADLANILGATVDKNGVVIQTAEDSPKPVALGFRAKKSNGKYRYFWLYTKGDSIEFQTPTTEGTIMARKKADDNGTHPSKTEVTEGDTGATGAIATWYTSVYEPKYTE